MDQGYGVVKQTRYSKNHSSCSYQASAQDKANGVLKMHRKVTSNDVQDYASHLPRELVALQRDEDIEYKRGVLAHSAGVTQANMMPMV